MKRILITVIACFPLLTSCSGKSENGTHTHEDGQEHINHMKIVEVDSLVADTSVHSHDRQSVDSTAKEHGHSHDRP